MTNPPVPATPLDVEACVRLLADYRRILKEAVHKCSIRSVCHAPFPCSTCRGICGDIDQVGALASALPGMGKDSERIDWFEVNAFNAGFHDGACEVLDADGNEWRAKTFREAVDRAAQPEETSADEV